VYLQPLLRNPPEFDETTVRLRCYAAQDHSRSPLAERKHVSRYWSINTAVTAVPLIAHPSSIELLIQFDIPASIKLTLVIRTKLPAAISGGGLFGGNVLPTQYCPCGQERQVLVGVLHYHTTPMYESYCQISFVFGVTRDADGMVSFRRRVRIAGAGFGVLHATQLIGHAARLLYYINKMYDQHRECCVCGTIIVIVGLLKTQSSSCCVSSLLPMGLLYS